MKLILHIGAEKTGTTSIQLFLKQNRSIFCDSNILIPVGLGEGNNRLITSFGLDNAHKESQTLRSLYHKILSNSPHENLSQYVHKCLAPQIKPLYDTILISSEHLSSRLLSRDQLLLFKGKLEDLYDFTEIHIIAYVREQLSAHASSYSTSIRSGNVKPISWSPQKRWDYNLLFQTWISVFPKAKLIIRDYARDLFFGNDICIDFLHALDLQCILNHPGLIKSKRTNESLDKDGLELLRLLNKYIPFLEPKGLNNDRLQIMQLLNKKFCTGNKITVSQEIADRFYQFYRMGNSQIDRDHGTSLNKYLKSSTIINQ